MTVAKRRHGVGHGLVDKNINGIIHKPKPRNEACPNRCLVQDHKCTSVRHSAREDRKWGTKHIDRKWGTKHIDSHASHNACLQAAKYDSEHNMLSLQSTTVKMQWHIMYVPCQVSNGGMLPCRTRLSTICASAPHTVVLVHVHLCRTCISAQPI